MTAQRFIVVLVNAITDINEWKIIYAICCPSLSWLWLPLRHSLCIWLSSPLSILYICIYISKSPWLQLTISISSEITFYYHGLFQIWEFWETMYPISSNFDLLTIAPSHLLQVSITSALHLPISALNLI